MIFAAWLFLRVESAMAVMHPCKPSAAAESYICRADGGRHCEDAPRLPRINKVTPKHERSNIRSRSFFHTAMPVAFHRNFLDADTCQTFTEAVIMQGKDSFILESSFRSRMQEIAGIDLLVTNKGRLDV